MYYCVIFRIVINIAVVVRVVFANGILCGAGVLMKCICVINKAVWIIRMLIIICGA